MPRKKKHARYRNPQEDKLVNLLDELEEFKKFKKEMLPAIMKDLYANKPAKEILEKYKSLAAARKIMALLSPNDDTATRAAQQILDRTEGKATEKVEHTHKYDNLTEEQLEAMLISREKETGVSVGSSKKRKH